MGQLIYGHKLKMLVSHKDGQPFSGCNIYAKSISMKIIQFDVCNI